MTQGHKIVVLVRVDILVNSLQLVVHCGTGVSERRGVGSGRWQGLDVARGGGKSDIFVGWRLRRGSSGSTHGADITSRGIGGGVGAGRGRG